MTTSNFSKLQAFALLFAAIVSPLSALADIDSKQATIEFALGTNEVTGGKAECAFYFGGNITGIGTGSITAKGESESLRVLTMTADDCIDPTSAPLLYSAEGNLTLSAGNSSTITAHYSTKFSPTVDTNDNPYIYEYKDFKLTITGGTGRFKGIRGSGTADGTSNIGTGLGFIEGIVNISK